MLAFAAEAPKAVRPVDTHAPPPRGGGITASDLPLASQSEIQASQWHKCTEKSELQLHLRR